MSAETLDQLRSRIFELTESERAELACELVMSLDESSDNSVEKAWSEEIARRISSVKAGQARLLNREEFREKMREKLER